MNVDHKYYQIGAPDETCPELIALDSLFQSALQLVIN
jgi:hypothetical protein